MSASLSASVAVRVVKTVPEVVLSPTTMLYVTGLKTGAAAERCNIERRHEISNNVVCATSKVSDQPLHTRSQIRAFASRLNIL